MTISRRQLLGQASGAFAGIAFTACGLGHHATAQTAPTPHRRREVVVSGKRVRTVDVHAHCHIPEATALMGVEGEHPGARRRRGPHQDHGRAGHRHRGAEHQPGLLVQGRPRPRRARSSSCRTKSSPRLCAKHPDRFVGLASVALQHPDLAAEQLEDAVKRLGLRGALIGGSVNGDGACPIPKFHPFWAKAEQLGVLIFIHPQGTPEIDATGRLKGNGVLGNVIGNPLETTIALSHLIFEGTLDAYPGLKICARAWRRLPALLRRPLGPRLRDVSGALHRDAEEEADRVPEAAVLRFDGLHRRRAAPPDRRGRRRARSSWAPTIRFRGPRHRSTTSSTRPASATPTASRCSAKPRKSCSGSSPPRS